MPTLPYDPPRPIYRRLDAVSTADASHPEVSFRDGGLTLRFTDYCERPICLIFTDVVAFRWQDEMPLPAEVRDDAAYEVFSSPLVAELAVSGALTPGTTCRHFMLCFNEAGAALEVVAAGMQM